MQDDRTAEVTNPLTQKSQWYSLRTVNEVFESSGASYSDSLFNILQYLPTTSKLYMLPEFFSMCTAIYSNVGVLLQKLIPKMDQNEHKKYT